MCYFGAGTFQCIGGGGIVSRLQQLVATVGHIIDLKWRVLYISVSAMLYQDRYPQMYPIH